MRKFETGATRDNDTEKFDYEGFLSPQVQERFAAYMHKHRKQADGELRASDNWQKGIPRDAYMKSMYRHFMEVWKAHRNLPAEDLEESLCAMMFNVQGYLFEVLNDPYLRITSSVRNLPSGADRCNRPNNDQHPTTQVLGGEGGVLSEKGEASAENKNAPSHGNHSDSGYNDWGV